MFFSSISHKRFALFIFLLLSKIVLYSQTNIQADSSGYKGTLFDSSEIKTLRPDKKSEEKTFSDPKLSYDNEVAAKKGFFEKLLEWLAEKLFGKAGPKNVSTAREIIIWTIVIAAIVIVVWLLWRSEMVSLIRPKPKSTAFNFTDITGDLSEINFDEKIKAALAQQDLRLAIRWHYLKVLYILDRIKAIHFVPFKNNIDYSNELSGKIFQPEFIRLSRVYEYVWYGQFTLNEKDYQNYAADFEAFEKQTGV